MPFNPDGSRKDPALYKRTGFKMKYQGNKSGFPFKAADEAISEAAQKAGAASAVDTTATTASTAESIGKSTKETADVLSKAIIDYGKAKAAEDKAAEGEEEEKGKK